LQVIPFLIIVGLVVAGGFLVAFFWALNDGQFDDDVTPALRVPDAPKTNSETKDKLETKK
jgi:cbb3-type cytochrome oxidase maturation protein